MNSLMDLGGGVGWIGMLIIGGVAGWIAEKVMKTDMGIIMNIIVGVIGSYIGTVLARMLSINVGQIVDQWFVSNLIVAAGGAIVLLFVVKLVRNRSA